MPHKHSVAMCQPSKLGSGVQFPGEALTLNPIDSYYEALLQVQEEQAA